MPKGPLGAPRLTKLGPLSRSTKKELEESWNECPEGGKEREICIEIKTAAIAILEDQSFFAECKDLVDINSGSCFDVAEMVYNRVDGVRVMSVADKAHGWIKYNGRHYDVEVPTGVDDPLDLPIFYRMDEDQLLPFAQILAIQTGRRQPETLEESIRDITHNYQ